jgi:predicted metalloendopeptidase
VAVSGACAAPRRRADPAPTIDGLTADQRFYMGWAQGWKAKEREESLRQQVLTNVHSPEMYRANGPVRPADPPYRRVVHRQILRSPYPPPRRILSG